MNQPHTTGQLAEQLQRFAPDTPCVVHLWVADDFDDAAPELTPGEVLATIVLVDATLDADVRLSCYVLRDYADTILGAREEICWREPPTAGLSRSDARNKAVAALRIMAFPSAARWPR